MNISCFPTLPCGSAFWFVDLAGGIDAVVVKLTPEDKKIKDGFSLLEG